MTSRPKRAKWGGMSNVPANYQKIQKDAAEGIVSPRQAIKARCQQCVCFEDTVARIRDCNVKLCALWAYRPYQVSRAAEGTTQDA